MLTDEEFAKLSASGYDLQAEKAMFNSNLKDCYYTIVNDILPKYCDLEESYYPVIALWIMGTYCHDSFKTYPYLFLNATKGSGKSRLLRLISVLSKNGELLGSLTESGLFRGSKGNTLCIDEFEQIRSDEKSALRELLNSAYKKGLIIKRYRKSKDEKTGEKYEVEAFDVYTSIAMANITGMESVLADRCITLVLEKSSNNKITRLIEDFESDSGIIQIKKLLGSIDVMLNKLISNSNISKDWNDHVLGVFREHAKNTELTAFFHSIDETEVEGRNLELLLPLYFIAYLIDDEKGAINTILRISKKIIQERNDDDVVENNDKVLLKFLTEKVSSDLGYSNFISIIKITSQYKEYLGEDNTWINSVYIGRVLKRLKLIKSKKRESQGIKVLLDYEKLKAK